MRSLAEAEDQARLVNLRQTLWNFYATLHVAAMRTDGIYSGSSVDVAALTNYPVRSIEWKLRELIDADLLTVESAPDDSLRITIH